MTGKAVADSLAEHAQNHANLSSLMFFIARSLKRILKQVHVDAHRCF